MRGVFVRHLRIDGRLLVARRELDRRRRRIHRDALRDCTGIQRGIHRHLASRLYDDVRLNEPAEAAGFNAHRIGAGLDEVEDELPAESLCLAVFTPVLVLLNVTVALGTTAPEPSVTRPRTWPKALTERC